MQLETLSRACSPFQKEYAGNRFYLEAVSRQAGPGYGYIEAQALHGFIRCFKPRRIFEVGSGVSTWCIRSAANLNEQETGEAMSITCIEPNPTAFIKSLSGITLIPQTVQTVPFEAFTELANGDLLFIDSSHTVKTGSDVNFLILEILPRLQRGVFVHIHDINLPYDHPRDVLNNFYHSQETSLVHAFLIGNSKVSIVFCLSLLHYERRAQLAEIFPEYDAEPNVNGMRVGRPFEQPTKHFPSSLYLRME
jgi:Methyltransferase domain